MNRATEAVSLLFSKQLLFYEQISVSLLHDRVLLLFLGGGYGSGAGGYGGGWIRWSWVRWSTIGNLLQFVFGASFRSVPIFVSNVSI